MKQQNEWSRCNVCRFEIVYVIPYYHYISVNVLYYSKYVIHHTNVVTKPPRTLPNYL